MAFDAQKTILLEKQYLYVRASKGFVLEGTSTERIWTNTGYYRFLVSNVASSLGNSYVTIHFDSSDNDFIAYCSDLFMEEIQNSVTTAVENIETALDDFAQTNHDDIDTLSSGLSSAMQIVTKKLSQFDGTLDSINIFENAIIDLSSLNFEFDTDYLCTFVPSISIYNSSNSSMVGFKITQSVDRFVIESKTSKMFFPRVNSYYVLFVEQFEIYKIRKVH